MIKERKFYTKARFLDLGEYIKEKITYRTDKQLRRLLVFAPCLLGACSPRRS